MSSNKDTNTQTETENEYSDLNESDLDYDNRYEQGYWKLNTSILKQKDFQKLFNKFWKDWQSQKHKYDSLNQWWESGKIYFKILTITFSTKKTKKIDQKLIKLTQNILLEKIKTQPDDSRIINWQNKIDDIENYKKQVTIIRSKETTIINEETPNKLFFQEEQQKQRKKQITQLQNNQNKILTKNIDILQEWQNFYQTLYKKQSNCKITQQKLLKNIPKKVTIDQTIN